MSSNTSPNRRKRKQGFTSERSPYIWERCAKLRVDTQTDCNRRDFCLKGCLAYRKQVANDEDGSSMPVEAISITKIRRKLGQCCPYHTEGISQTFELQPSERRKKTPYNVKIRIKRKGVAFVQSRAPWGWAGGHVGRKICPSLHRSEPLRAAGTIDVARMRGMRGCSLSHVAVC